MSGPAARLCTKCGASKPPAEFYTGHSQCKACKREYQRSHYEANSETVRERSRQYREANRETVLVRQRERYEANRDARLEYGRQYHEANRDARNEGRHRRYEADREEVLAHYSPDTPPCCACCSTTGNLAIDHVNGGGGEHRKEVGGARFYHWLITENFPSGYQVLCVPCNSSKREGKRCRLSH